MAEIRTADIVLSLTGRDRGQLMLVVCWRTDVRAGPKTRSASAASM